MPYSFQTTPQRSANMARIRSAGNATTEQRVAQIFRAAKITGWRRHFPVPGKPDFAFPKARLAVFVDGCFWHGCPRCYRAPASNSPYWQAKVARNRARDRRVRRALRARGWSVLSFWEHALRSEATVTARVRRALSRSDAD